MLDSIGRRVRPRVLFICPSLVGAGVERRVCILFKQLNLSRFDMKLGLLRAQGEFLHEIPREQRIYVAPKLWIKIVLFPLTGFTHVYNFLMAIQQIREMVRTTEPAIVVTFTLETSLPMYVAGSSTKVRSLTWIISEDSNTVESIGYHLKPKRLAQFVQWLVSMAYRKADFITTVSSAVRLAVSETYGIPPTKINTLHNPVDGRLIRQKSVDCLGQNYDFEFIMGAGRFVRVKQFDLLIRAFANVRKERNIKLVILGEGPEREHLQTLVDKLQLRNEVYFPGFVDNPWIFMSRAKLFVLTSKIEGFSNVIVEAMAAGCPVIATFCGGPEDIIRDNQNGVLVAANPDSIAAEIIRLLNNRTERLRLKLNALKDCEQYCPDRICGKFNRLMEDLLSPDISQLL